MYIYWTVYSLNSHDTVYSQRLLGGFLNGVQRSNPGVLTTPSRGWVQLLAVFSKKSQIGHGAWPIVSQRAVRSLVKRHRTQAASPMAARSSALALEQRDAFLGFQRVRGVTERTGAWKRIMATSFDSDVNKVEYHYSIGEMSRGKAEDRAGSVGLTGAAARHKESLARGLSSDADGIFKNDDVSYQPRY